MEEKTFFRIKDISEFVGEAPSTLRYWEDEFDVLNPKRGEKGRRLYTPEDLDTIRKIQYLLRTKGMHIAAAKEQLRRNEKNVGTRVEAIRELVQVQTELKNLLANLNKRK